MKKIIALFLGLLMFSVAMTVLYLGMRAVMMVGGACAEGGAYQIAVHCPKGTAWQVPLSIFVGLAGAFLYFYAATAVKGSPQWGYLFWTVLFCGLGWNFLDFGLQALSDPEGGAIELFVLAGFFILMGLGPLVMIPMGKMNGDGYASPTLIEVFIGSKMASANTRMLLLALHIITVAGGIYLGTMVTSM